MLYYHNCFIEIKVSHQYLLNTLDNLPTLIATTWYKTTKCGTYFLKKCPMYLFQ